MEGHPRKRAVAAVFGRALVRGCRLLFLSGSASRGRCYEIRRTKNSTFFFLKKKKKTLQQDLRLLLPQGRQLARPGPHQERGLDAAGPERGREHLLSRQRLGPEIRRHSRAAPAAAVVGDGNAALPRRARRRRPQWRDAGAPQRRDGLRADARARRRFGLVHQASPVISEREKNSLLFPSFFSFLFVLSKTNGEKTIITLPLSTPKLALSPLWRPYYIPCP